MKKFAVSAIALAIAGLMATPALAVVTPYGSARMETFWKQVMQPSSSTADDDGDLLWQLYGNARFGAMGSTDDIAGRVEFGLATGQGTDNVTLRLGYADYKTEMGTLRIGQWYTDTSLWLSDQGADGDRGNIAWGALYDGREPMIQWSMPMGLSIELLQPEIGNKGDSDLGADSTDTFLPKIGIKYTFKASMVNAQVAAAFQTYKLEDAANNDLDGEAINSYYLGAYGKGTFGPATVAGMLAYGMNLGNHGIAGGGEAALVGTTIEDATQFQGWLSVALAAGPGTATLGAGYQSVDRDDFTDPDAKATYWVNYNYPIAKTFFVVPEVSYFDGMDNSAGVEEADSLYVGAKWQMNF